ncbi:MAG: MMPL family transporter, partial [Flavisolibacter sp.]|nr:MMPL family transporter [Flavisolibacter sp.]
NHPKYVAYQAFIKKFGEESNLLVIGLQTPNLFQAALFNDYNALQKHLKKIKGVEDVVSVPTAVNLVKNAETEKLEAVSVFPDTALSQSELDSSAALFLSLPFYKGLLYNQQTAAWLMGVRINRDILASKQRTEVVGHIVKAADAFGERYHLNLHYSGLPFIRTMLASRIQEEMRWFTLISLVLSAIILLLFFRSFSNTLLSLAVVLTGVIWSFGTMHLLGYKITLLTALIPPLIVVIGIPNCIYFLNKFHTSFKATGEKREALVQMIAKMGVVTLFCNIAAAIGFAVFALTDSPLLKEFGVVAGINIMMLFFISLVLIPAVLSMLAPPKEKHLRYLHNARLQRWLSRLERWSLNHRRLIYIITTVVLAISIAGIFRLKSVGYIVDDLPKSDKIYTDLKFFETHFKGVMPLEIVVDTRQKNGLRRNMLKTVTAMDSLEQYLAAQPYIGRPLSIAEGLKFAKQAFFEGDSANYSMPSEYDLPALAQYLSMRSNNDSGDQNSFSKLVASFMDSTRQQARISVSMQDVGSARLPVILDSIQAKAEWLFNRDSIEYVQEHKQTASGESKTTAITDSSTQSDTAAAAEAVPDETTPDNRAGKRKFDIKLTGTSVTFSEGVQFIISGLKESIFWAFLLIAACMLYLFRSVRILLCSLIPNVIPLVITAGVMGWTGVPLKPSTVLIFSVALGIAIDITIRFLVNYKQELKPGADPKQIVVQTIHSTGLSIIYTSIVLIAGFVIFCFSSFGGTFSLGWLTSLTLVAATAANLILLPALLLNLMRLPKK